MNTLADNVPQALKIRTEKARSELVISPILIEILELRQQKISFFSGIDFKINVKRGLAGHCDFIVGLGEQKDYLNRSCADYCGSEKRQH